MRLPATLILACLPAQLLAQGLNLIPGVKEIASDSVSDVAVAAVDQPNPVVYYNPRMARRFDPALTRFFFAHEYGHIQHHHTRVGLADLPESTRDSIFQAQELEADCYAAALPGSDARSAAEAALRYFTRMGPFRFDREHPTGAQRSSRLLMCMSGPRDTLGYGRGDTGVELGPVSGEPDKVQFEVAAPRLARSGGGAAILWLDGQRIGQVSNMRFPMSLSVDRFGAGIHNYRISVDLFDLDQNPNGSLIGRGQVLVRNGDRFRIQWAKGTNPELLREDVVPSEARDLKQ